MYYILYENNAFRISSEIADTAVCTFLSPICCEDGSEYAVSFDRFDGNRAIYRDD